MIVLVTGGVRSGKSSYALRRALRYPPPRVFVATAEAVDEEMASRIALHRKERGDEFVSVEEPIDLAGALRDRSWESSVVVVDCLGVWVSNVMFREGGEAVERRIEEFLGALGGLQADCLMVTNEVGMGVVPPSPEGRLFRDVLGGLNQRVAAVADEVVLMVCGRPLRVK